MCSYDSCTTWLFSFVFPLRNRPRFALLRFLRLGFFLFFFLYGIVSAPRFFDSCTSAFFFSFSFTESSALRAFSIPACIRTLETIVSSCSCRGVPSSPIPSCKQVCNGYGDLWHCKTKSPSASADRDECSRYHPDS